MVVYEGNILVYFFHLASNFVVCISCIISRYDIKFSFYASFQTLQLIGLTTHYGGPRRTCGWHTHAPPWTSMGWAPPQSWSSRPCTRICVSRCLTCATWISGSTSPRRPSMQWYSCANNLVMMRHILVSAVFKKKKIIIITHLILTDEILWIVNLWGCGISSLWCHWYCNRWTMIFGAHWYLCVGWIVLWGNFSSSYY